MASAFGWFGPLIDLSRASSHIGDFVQLLVFVHRSFPVQCKFSKRDITRTDIEVGDDTTPYFLVSLWQKNMASIVAAGDVVLLQNFKIAKYGDAVEARTVQWSSLISLVHPHHSLLSKAVEELVTGCRVGATTKDKLTRVIKWVQQSRSTICNIKLQSTQTQQIEHLARNWTVLEEERPRDCFSLIEVSQLTTSCKAVVCASIGEIVPLHSSRTLGDTKNEKIFISRRVYRTKDGNLVDDLICTGCQLCGSPLDSKLEQSAVPLICSKSSTRLHSICSIYRPFMLYLWDESDYMPVLVKNRIAEILFGNIKAGKVYSAYKEETHSQNLGPRYECKDKDTRERPAINPRSSGEGLPSANTLEVDKSSQSEDMHLPDKFNLYRVWLILLKMLLKQGKNSPLKFEINVDPSLDIESGKFEMVSAKMPCFGTKRFHPS
ncbi:uncharacterized protein LOC106764323 isoform X2 [Vigna radiata var. radiata]|uniref:Uncharacterized protein LOC106764323 isoform X2 n=1 Tax=Vigna radiata var. radiata TaxID=3916 RepID=A0A1S3UDI5_VIGRR|nr:uncharacterized protein LOC106764323 isoform X2 [Vigna radiata var. radiata]